LGYLPKTALEIDIYLGLAKENNAENDLKTVAAAAGGTVLFINLV
jgi:hypothetical protein